MRSYTIEIKPRSLFGKTRRLPPSLNDRVHWAMRGKWAHEFCEEAFYACKGKKIPHLARASIVIVNVSTNPRDFDNLAASAKPIIDGVVLAGVLKDDDPDHLVELRMRSERALHKVDEKVFIHIEEEV